MSTETETVTIGELRKRVSDLKVTHSNGDHEDTAIALEKLGLGLTLTNSSFEAAAESFAEALAMRERLNAADPALPRLLTSLGSAHRSSNNFDQAMGFYKRALALHEARCPEGDAQTAQALSFIGATHMCMRDHRDAAVAYKEALRIRVRVLGVTHDDTQGSRRSLLACQSMEPQPCPGCTVLVSNPTTNPDASKCAKCTEFFCSNRCRKDKLQVHKKVCTGA
jgi:hypothetical protein